MIESKKRRQGIAPQSLGSRPSLLKQKDFISTQHMGTVPESISDVKGTTHGHVLPLSSAHLANLGLEPVCNSQSPPNGSFFDTVPGLTPTSSSDSTGGFSLPFMDGVQQNSTFPATPLSGMFADPSGMDAPISDISTMLFTSSDPLAYPTQPTTSFENDDSHVFHRSTNSPAVGVDMKSHTAMFAPAIMPPAGPGSRLNDSEVQLFGNMPMYLMQGMHPYREFPPQNVSPHMPMSGSSLPFDNLLDHDEWAQTFIEPALGTSNATPPMEGSQQYQQGPGINEWH